jgi:hypothetical protein
MGANSNSQ